MNSYDDWLKKRMCGVGLLLLLGLIFGAPTVNGAPLLDVSRKSVTSHTDDLVDFALLGYDHKKLSAPFDTADIYLGVPANWDLQLGMEVELDLHFVSNSLLNGQVTAGQSNTLSAYFNDQLIDTLTLRSSGKQKWTVTIPEELLRSNRSDGRYRLHLEFEGTEDCTQAIPDTLFVYNSSAFSLPHKHVRPAADFSRFPYPFYQRTFFPDKVIVVLPENPSAMELEAAFSVSAGLSSMSGGGITLGLGTVAKMLPLELASSHLIFVGKEGSFEQLLAPKIPGAYQQLEEIIASENENDGVIQILNSPWNDQYMILLVTGQKDDGVVKAGQAVSEGNIRPTANQSIAIVTQTKPQTIASPEHRPVQSLAELGYKTETLKGPGFESNTYLFHIPSGLSPDGDAFIQLAYSHSSLLNPLRSDVQIRLNKQLVASVPIVAGVADFKTVEVKLPYSLLRAGVNELNIGAEMNPVIECPQPEAGWVWSTIFSESELHIPLKENSEGFRVPFSLAAYPQPFDQGKRLENLALIVSNDPQYWAAAQEIVTNLGDVANILLADFRVAFADDIPDQLLSGYDWIIIGEPAQLPILQQIGEDLPAPFQPNSNELVESTFPISYQILENESVGYLELVRTPWDASRTILVLLGNNSEGLNWATKKLISTSDRSQLNGNFVFIVDNKAQVQNSKFEPFPTLANDSVGGNLVDDQSNNSGDRTVEDERNALLTGLIGSIVLTVLLIIGVGAYYVYQWKKKKE